MKSKWIAPVKWIITVVIVALMYWFMLPPINWRSVDFWTFIAISILVCVAINASAKMLSILGAVKKRADKKTRVEGESGHVKEEIKSAGKPVKIALIAIGAIIAFALVAEISGWALFSASKYGSLLTYEAGSFKSEISNIVTSDNGKLNMDSVPVVDRDTAERLSLRKLGEMSDLVSQFEVDANYNTQINYHGTPTRVTPLIYGDVFKWLNNQSAGIPAYITVNMETQETSLVRLKEGIKYSESEYFFRDLKRHLRFCYPTKIFDNITFEIDENGMPYWIASTLTYRVGVWSGRDINGAIICNAITGECQYYDIADVPQWVDQAYDPDIIIEQLTYNGEYVNGYWNSIFGQKDVLQPTDGYNYIALNDDVYLYTGMTSVSSDQSNVGFVLVNLRTKGTMYYVCPGAEEFSAMESAQGKVQEKNYTSTFPLLLNVNGRPTYFMSLKDSAGLVKMYAFVDVQQYQIVGTGTSVKGALTSFFEELKSNEEIDMANDPNDTVEEKELSGTIEAIEPVVVSSSTRYYFRLTGDDTVYIADISKNDALPFVKAGDQVTITYPEREASSITVSSFTVKP